MDPNDPDSDDDGYNDKVESDARAKAESDAKALNDAKVLSAKNKLKALGLTDAEVTALVG
jgi:hypothetical protein